MNNELKTAQGLFKLDRFPVRKNEKLRAWDAADEYLLQYVADNVDLASMHGTVLLNDGFGALAVALQGSNTLLSISDSYLSQQATQHNLLLNQLSADCVQLLNSLDWPEQSVDLVLIKVPKTLALLEDQLVRLQALLTDQTVIIAAGMVKAMSSSVWKLLETYLGPTKPSLAKKKARLIFVQMRLPRTVLENPFPSYYQLEKTSYQICNHANVFSRQSLDIGSRFLLQYLPTNSAAKDIVDLGCGNGIMGLMLAESHADAKLYFVDESYMAIASAKENFCRAFVDRSAEFRLSDGLIGFAEESMDLIVCNPPFHQQNVVGNHIALAMFLQSYRVLRKGGELWVIGNRHLGYHAQLKSIFKSCNEVASNAKFVIWRVSKCIVLPRCTGY